MTAASWRKWLVAFAMTTAALEVLVAVLSDVPLTGIALAALLVLSAVRLRHLRRVPVIVIAVVCLIQLTLVIVLFAFVEVTPPLSGADVVLGALLGLSSALALIGAVATLRAPP